MRDPYDILGVQRSADAKAIKSAFRRHAKKLHPDANTNDPKAAARFAELQCDLGGLAYEMAIRNHVRVEVLVQRAAILQNVDAELSEFTQSLSMLLSARLRRGWPTCRLPPSMSMLPNMLGATPCRRPTGLPMKNRE